MMLYAPPTLRLKPGTAIDTLDGVYTVPAEGAVWHSHAEWMRRNYDELYK